MDSNELIQICAMVGAVASALGAVVALAHATQNRRRERSLPDPTPDAASAARTGLLTEPVERESRTAGGAPAQVWPGSPPVRTPPPPTEPPSRSAHSWYQEHGTKPNGWPSDPPITSGPPSGAPNHWWLNGSGRADRSRTALRRQARR